MIGQTIAHYRITAKKPPFTKPNPNLHRPFQKACFPSPKGIDPALFYDLIQP
jgi:hypothetical protein